MFTLPRGNPLSSFINQLPRATRRLPQLTGFGRCFVDYTHLGFLLCFLRWLGLDFPGAKCFSSSHFGCSTYTGSYGSFVEGIKYCLHHHPHHHQLAGTVGDVNRIYLMRSQIDVFVKQTEFIQSDLGWISNPLLILTVLFMKIA